MLWCTEQTLLVNLTLIPIPSLPELFALSLKIRMKLFSPLVLISCATLSEFMYRDQILKQILLTRI